MEQSILIQDKYIKEYRIKVGTMVRESREKKGYSMDHLAKLMNLNSSTISKIENGRFAYNIDVLARLSWILNCDLELLTDNI